MGAVEKLRSSKLSLKKKGGVFERLWMRMDRTGQSELIECDKSVIIKRALIPVRDLRILGPIFSKSSTILARERAMIINLEFIRAIITAEEVLLLDPLRQEVVPFVDKLRKLLLNKRPNNHFLHQNQTPSPTPEQWSPWPETVQEQPLPFEFQVLEIALEVVCSYLDTNVAELERGAYPALDDLTRNVSSKNLDHVRGLKSILTRLLARSQKVRDEIEHLLDDNEDMARLYVTRRGTNNHPQAAPAASSTVPTNTDNHDVEELEMLLESYLMQLDITRNKILSVREYIDDTEDYVNIQLDNQRNELIKLQLMLTISFFAIAIEGCFAGAFGVNIPMDLFRSTGKYGYTVAGMTTFTLVCYVLVLGYARRKKLI